MLVEKLRPSQFSFLLEASIEDRSSDIQEAIKQAKKLLKEFYTSPEAEAIIDQLDECLLNSCRSHIEIDSILFKEQLYTPSFLVRFNEILQSLNLLEKTPDNLSTELKKLSQLIFYQLPSAL